MELVEGVNVTGTIVVKNGVELGMMTISTHLIHAAAAVVEFRMTKMKMPYRTRIKKTKKVKMKVLSFRSIYVQT